MQSKRARDLRQRASVQMYAASTYRSSDESSARASSVALPAGHPQRSPVANSSDKLRTLIFLFVETDDALLLAITIDELLRHHRA